MHALRCRWDGGASPISLTTLLVPDAKALGQETSSGMLEFKVNFKSACLQITSRNGNDLLEQSGRD